MNVVVLFLLRERKVLDSLQSNVSWMSGFCLGMSKTFMKCNKVNLSKYINLLNEQMYLTVP